MLLYQAVTMKNWEKLLAEEFNKPVYWNEYQTKIETRNLDDRNFTRFPLDAFFQGVRRLFLLAFDNTNNGVNKVERNNHQKYFLPRVHIANCIVLIDGRNFYDQQGWSLHIRVFVRLSVL